jgi:hypothetical protein
MPTVTIDSRCPHTAAVHLALLQSRAGLAELEVAWLR